MYRHPTAKNRPTAVSVSQTLQKSDRALLANSVQVTDITKENRSMILGAPVTAGSQLFIDLQKKYTYN